MQFFRVDVYDRQDDDFCFIERPPKAISLLSSYIAKGREAKHEYPENVVAVMSPEDGGIMLSDVIANNELSFICSKPLMEIIKACCGDTCEYLPVSIENHKGRIASSDYYYVNPLVHHTCLDLQASVIKYSASGKIIKIKKYVLNLQAALEGPDLFRIPEHTTRYFMSETLADIIKSEMPEVTNLNLYPVETV